MWGKFGRLVVISVLTLAMIAFYSTGKIVLAEKKGTASTHDHSSNDDNSSDNDKRHGNDDDSNDENNTEKSKGKK